MQSKTNIAIFASGRGSNAIAIIEYWLKQKATKQQNFAITLLFTDKLSSNIKAIALKYSLNFVYLKPKDFTNKNSFEQEIILYLKKYNVDFIVLAGYMRIVNLLVEHYQNKILNIHPSLLPAFPGLLPHQQAINKNVLFSGATVHLVSKNIDDGLILSQAITTVETNDTEILAKKILKIEHVLYPLTIARYIKQTTLDTCKNSIVKANETNETLKFSDEIAQYYVR